MATTLLCLLAMAWVPWGNLGDKPTIPEAETGQVQALIGTVITRTAFFRLAVPLTFIWLLLFALTAWTTKNGTDVQLNSHPPPSGGTEVGSSSHPPPNRGANSANIANSSGPLDLLRAVLAVAICQYSKTVFSRPSRESSGSIQLRFGLSVRLTSNHSGLA